METTKRLKIYAARDMSGLWTASSSDIDGLDLRARSLRALEQMLEEILPGLLLRNPQQGLPVLIVDNLAYAAEAAA